MQVKELKTYGVGYHKENYPYLSITTQQKKYKAKCLNCGEEMLSWDNYAEVKMAEELGIERELNAICGNCGITIPSDLLGVGKEVKRCPNIK